MNFLKKLFHSCRFQPYKIERVLGYRPIYSEDSIYYIANLGDREVWVSFMPKIDILISCCIICGAETYSEPTYLKPETRYV